MPAPEWFTPNGFHFERASGFEIEQGRRLVGAHRFGSFHLLERDVDRQTISTRPRREAYFIHQTQCRKSERIILQDVLRRNSASRDGKSIEWNVPRQFAPALAHKIFDHVTGDARPFKFRGNVMSSRFRKSGELTDGEMSVIEMLGPRRVKRGSDK